MAGSKTWQRIWLALAIVGALIWVGLAPADGYPYEIIQYSGVLLLLGSLEVRRRIGPQRGLYLQQVAAQRNTRGYTVILTFTFFYLGIFFSKNWTPESVDFLYKFLPIIVVPAFIYLTVVGGRSDNAIRKRYFKPESETDILEKAGKESAKDGRND